MTTYFTYVDSPIGPLRLVGDGKWLTDLTMTAHKHARAIANTWRRDDAPFAEAIDQLAAYFAGRRQAFDLALAPQGTVFQRAVWAGLQTIAFGTTQSYGELARHVGAPRASRAVGLANGRNPISIIIPCHRVIGADGRLTGYGGGIERKRWLLRHEGVALSSNDTEQATLF